MSTPLNDDLRFVERILRRPRMNFGSAQSLRDVLALIYGYSVGRYPPNGHGFLPGFPEFVQCRLDGPVCTCHYGILLDRFGEMPWGDGLDAVWKLVLEWSGTGKDAATDGGAF
jgi:hypothetical protein